MTTTAEALHLQRLLEFLGSIQWQHAASLKHIEARLSWLQARHEERKLTVVKEPTQTNTADGFAIALQTVKYLEWRNRLRKGYDNGDEVETSKRLSVHIANFCPPRRSLNSLCVDGEGSTPRSQEAPGITSEVFAVRQQ